MKPTIQHGNEPKELVPPSSQEVIVVHEVESKYKTPFLSGVDGTGNGNDNGLGLGTDKACELDLVATADR